MLFSCDNEINKEFAISSDQQDTLTILKINNKAYLIDGDYKYDTIPHQDYLFTGGFYEYCNALIKWEKSKTIIYSDYCDIDSTKGINLEYKKITTSQFEEMRKDSFKYTYIYF